MGQGLDEVKLRPRLTWWESWSKSGSAWRNLAASSGPGAAGGPRSAEAGQVAATASARRSVCWGRRSEGVGVE